MIRSACLLSLVFISACASPGEAPLAKEGMPVKKDSVIAGMSEVLKLFKDTSFTEMQVFTYEAWIENIDKYPGYKIDSASYRDNLRFKGRQANYPHSSLLSIPEIEEYYEVEYHASYEFSLGNGYKGCIVRVIDPAGPHTINGIWMFVLDSVKGAFVNRVELARNIGEERYFSTAQSWIKDIDGDGVKDVLMRTRNEEAGNTGLSLDADDTLTASVMKDAKWIKLQMKDYKEKKKEYLLKQYNITYP